MYKDAIYFSMHKFVGGVDSPGKVTWLPIPWKHHTQHSSSLKQFLSCCYFHSNLKFSLGITTSSSSIRKSINLAIPLASSSPKLLSQIWWLWFCVLLVAYTGILVAKKQLFENSTPHSCGGGTVFFVSRVNNHAYSKNELRHFANQGIFLSLVSTV